MICIKCHRDAPDGPYCCHCGASQGAKGAGKPKKRGNGQGTVFKRGSTYYAQVTTSQYVTEDGKFHQVRKTKGGFKSKAAAAAYIPTMLAQQDTRYTFRRLWDIYKEAGLTKLAKSKQTAYKIAADRWAKILSREVADVGLGDLQDVLNTETRTYYPARDMQSVMSHLYKIAMADQRATVNLARLLVLPKLEEEEPEPFLELELRKMWDAYGAGETFLGGVLLMVYSGMMPGELMVLTADNIDTEAREITGVGLKTKKRKRVAIVYPPLIDPVVEQLLADAGKGGKIITMRRDAWYDRYHVVMAKIGVRDLPPYSCRHTTATALALGNIAPSAIQEVMRHSKLTTTQRYIHMTNTEAHAAIDTLKKEPQKKLEKSS